MSAVMAWEGGEGMFRAVHSGLTVRQIATGREALWTCGIDDAVSAVLAANREGHDFIPVIGAHGRIVGLLHAAGAGDAAAPGERVADRLLPLSEDYLIGADASILDFMIDADRHPCRLLLAGSRISGLVTLSDLQKLPVRVVLFALITELELTMAAAIRQTHPDSEAWLALLTPDRIKRIKEEMERSKTDDGFVDALLFTQFGDKKRILTKSRLLDRSRASLQGALEAIERLRDRIAHANDYASTRDDARQVCATIRDALELRRCLAATIPPGG